MNTIEERSWKDIERETLTMTNAQRVHQLLRKLEGQRDRVQTRWIWELLQNARDTSAGKPGSLKCSVAYEQEEVLLEHNGDPFNREQMSRVIYHGSTKAEDKGKLGKYGSGLLTTHLLSNVVHVSGKLVDGREFNYPLCRVPTSVETIYDCMQASAERFNSSLESGESIDLPDGFTTRFRYPVEDESSDFIVRQGIEGLKEMAPFILAFNEEFSRISVESLDEKCVFGVSEPGKSLNNGVHEIIIRRSGASNSTDGRYFLVRKGDTSIAVQVARAGNSTSCLPVRNIPRLFVGLPLIGTEDFSFPAVINSFQFTTSDEDRDGVNLWMNESDPANQNNQAAIKEACALLISLIQFAGESGWEGVFELADLPSVPTRNWLKAHRLQDCLTENLLEPLLSTPAVICEYGTDGLAPLQAVLPHAEEGESVGVLWELLSGLKEFRLKLPRREEAAGWCRAVKSWAGLRDCPASEFRGVVDGGDLARYIEKTTGDLKDVKHGTLSDLQDALEDGIGAAQWVNKVLGFLKEGGRADEISECHIILDQAGRFNRLSDLFSDAGIDEELKNIADGIGLNLRQQLRDKRLTSLCDEDGKGAKGNQEVVEEIIARLNEMADSGVLGDGFATAGTRVFAWIAEHEKWDILSRFPGFAQAGEGSDREILRLGTVGQDGVEIPLAPVHAWDEGLQPFSELFPPAEILSTEFYDAVPKVDVWLTLASQHIVRTEIIVSARPSIPEFAPYDLPYRVDEDAKHEAREPVELTDVVHFRGDNSVIRRASRSPRRARLFWRFITEWLVIHDAQGLQAKEASCTCDENHHYYQSKWLLTIAGNSWVPLGNDRHTRATAQSLGRLFRDNGTPSIPDSVGIDRLLEAIRVSRFELMKECWAVDDQARVSVENELMAILRAAEKDPDRLGDAAMYLALLSKDPKASDYIKERIKQTEKVRLNKQFGNLVECLVKKTLEDKDFLVEGTGVGSDFAFKDIAEDDVGGLKISKDSDCWYVEVKATRIDAARMTPRQAKEAVEQGDRFLLCVVPVCSEDEPDLGVVKDKMRFVAGIGERVNKVCKNLDLMEALESQWTSESSDGVSLTLTGGSKRISIDGSVWANDGFPVGELRDRLLR